MRLRWDKTWGVPAVTGASCFIVGTGVGYVIASARLSKKVKEIEANQEMLREYFEAKMTSTEAEEVVESDKDEDSQTQTEEEPAMRELVAQMEDTLLYPEEEESYSVEMDQPVHSRVFADDPDDDEWDYAVEVPKRSDDRPYIIHRDEFFAEEAGFRQSTLTYYAGDNILCDEKESPIYNHDVVAGTLRFGHGSKDPNVVYVRNPVLEAEYEILLDRGHYQVEVLGAVIEDQMNEEDLKHSVYRYHKD